MEGVCQSDPADIRAYEIKEGLIWGTFLPYMSFLYHPLSVPKSANVPLMEQISELQLLSAKVMIHCLHNALGREEHYTILKAEGLVDYLVAIPWYLPDCCTDIARNMIREISKLVPLKPPSLCSLAKANLAKHTLGLKQVLNMKSMSDLF
jgi:hypothetical protein